MSDNSEEKVFHFIPHTHWEGAVFKNREEYLEMGLPNILRALALLKEYPTYRFALDQVCYVKPFLERYPQERASFQQFVDEGRLALVGGTDTMLDVNMPCGESFVRQVLYGKGWFQKTFNVDITVSWQLDTFGHHAQFPQLLKQAGFKSFWFFRGVPGWDTPTEFWWEGLDGTCIPAYWLVESYAITYGSPSALPEFTQFMQGRWDMLAAYARGNHRAGPAGADVVAPEEHIPTMVEAFNAQPDMPFTMQISTPQEYEAVAGPYEDAAVIRGELNPVFQGIYSSRIELKQRTRELENLLMTAEKLGVMLRSVGIETCDDVLWDAWEPMMFNQAHDLMSGVMTDHVYDDTIYSFDHARRLGQGELNSRLEAYCEAIDTAGEGIALVIVNSLGQVRTEAVTANVGFATRDVMGVRVLNPQGEAVPAQVLQSAQYATGGLVEATVAFIAQDIPTLGHAVYRVVPVYEADEVAVAVAGSPVENGIIENEFYRVEIDPTTGAMLCLLDKSANREVLSAPGNIVVQEADHGDLWEPYHSLDGASRVAMKDRHPIPERGAAVFSDEQTGEPGKGFTGPVVSEFTVEHPFAEAGHFRTIVRLYTGMPRIDISTRILNNDEFVRYRAIFPSTVTEGKVTHEIPFGAIERPVGIEFPAQNWADYSDATGGLTVLNQGLPGNNTDNGAMLLSLLRSTCIVAYGFGGGYEPGMSSDSGLERGKWLTFNYSLMPHIGDWRTAQPWCDGQAINAPLIALTTSNHQGTLPKTWSYLTVEPANVVVSTVKTSSDGVAILRVYEAAGIATSDVQIRLPVNVIRVEETNLLEAPGLELDIANGVLTFALGAFEIKTLRLIM